MSAADPPVSKPSGDYAINIVQNPELLEVAYRAIEAGAETEEELKTELAIGSDDIEIINKGFQIFDLGGKSDFEYELTPLKFEAETLRTRFRLHMLNAVASEADPRGWGLQSAIILSLEYLLAEEKQQFVQSDEALIKNIDNWHVELGYEPQSSQGRMELNKTKFSLWTNQAEYLGFLYPYREGRKGAYVVCFDQDLVARTIELAIEDVGDGEGVIFEEYLSWIDRNFFRIPLTPENAVPEPFARGLYNLVRDERLRIVKNGDPNTVSLPGIPRHERIASSSNYLKMQS